MTFQQQHHLMLQNLDGDFRMIRISSSLHEWSSKDVSLPFWEEKRPSVVAACKELLCLEYDDDYVLWNPFTNEHKLIPESKLELPSCPLVSKQYHCSTCTSFVTYRVFGLGFDAKSNDYKLIETATIYYYDDGTMMERHSSKIHITIYSLNSDSWKEIPYSKSSSHAGVCSVSLNGICYWGCILFEPRYVVAFDCASEEFSTFPLPNIPLGSDTCSSLIEFNGSLAFGNSSWYEVSKCFKFWIMEVENGACVWVRKEKLDVCGIGAWSPLGSWRNGASLLLQGIEGALFEYDYFTQNMKRIEEFSDKLFGMSLVSFVETGVKLNALEARKRKKKAKEKKGERKKEGGDEETRESGKRQSGHTSRS